MPPDSLFNGSSAFDIGHATESNAIAWLKSLSESVIMHTTTDELIAQVVARCEFDVPVLDVDGQWADEKEEELKQSTRHQAYDVFSDTFGGQGGRKIHIGELHVPFTGDRNLFFVQPSSRTLQGIHATVLAAEIVIRVSTEGKTSEQLRQVFTAERDTINNNLAQLRKDLSAPAKSVVNSARLYVEERKSRLLQGKTTVAAMGFPMRRRDNAPATYKAPEIKRKLPIAPPVNDRFGSEAVIQPGRTNVRFAPIAVIQIAGPELAFA